MIHTSYLANLKNIPNDSKKYSIMHDTPDYALPYIDKIYKKLIPEDGIYHAFKNNEITKSQFITKYREQLDKLNVNNIKKSLNNSVLLCTHPIGEFCHRHIVSEWLRDNMITVSELEVRPNLKRIHVEYTDKLTTARCNKNKDSIYVYADNIIKKGKSGQAIIRDCENAIGIPIKRFPKNNDESNLRDTIEDTRAVIVALNKIKMKSYNGYKIMLPKEGLGINLNNLGLHAPKIHILIHNFIEDNFIRYIK